MSKSKAGKASKAGAKDNLSWEASLQVEEIDDDDWKAGIILATSATIDDEFAVQLLINGIKSNTRKLVKSITREELLQQIRDGGKVAGKKVQGRESSWVGAYEIAKLYLDAGEEIPLAIWARIIKAKILTIKEEDKNRRVAEKAFLENRVKKPGEGGPTGRKSPGKKAAAKKGAAEATPETAAPKVESKLVKRGEEEFVAKYADDEPEDGPHQYICVAGFRDAYLPAVLISAGVKPWAVVRVSAEDYNCYNGLAPLNGPQSQPPPDAIEAFEKQKQVTMAQLNQYWRDVGLVLSQPGDGSTLHDIPILEFTYKLAHFVPFAEILASVTASPEEKLTATVSFCDDFCTMMYDLVDWHRQYQTWLAHSRIINVPQVAPPTSLDDYGQTAVAVPTSPLAGAEHPPPPPDFSSQQASTVDMRYYNTVLDSIPDELCTVPLVLHCMLEQVSATVEGRSPPDPNPARSDGLPACVVDIFNTLISKSSLSSADMHVLKSELQLLPQYNTQLEQSMMSRMTAPELYAFCDERALRQRSLSAGDENSSTTANNNNCLHCNKQPNGMVSARPLVDISDAERTILKYSPLALAITSLPEASNCSARRRAALQNMIASLSASTGLTPLELGYAMKLLMFESLTLPGVDEDGFIAMHSPETVLPWDDPYPFFRGMITEEELTQIKEEWKRKLAQQVEREREEDARRAAMQDKMSPPEAKTPPPPEPKSPARKSRKGSAKGERGASPKQRPGSKSPTSPKGSPKRGRSVTPPAQEPPRTSDSAGSKRGIMLRSGSGMRRSAFVHFERDQSGRPIRSRQRFDDLEIRLVDRPIDESIADIRRALRRKLTEYCFVEFFAPDALMQALIDCYYERPLLSAYRCRQDNSLLLAFSNPRNHKMFYCEDWAARVYTNVGFRKYLLYVAPNIGDWLVHQESAYMARLLATDLDDETTRASAAASSSKGEKGRKRSTSPKKGKKGEEKPATEDKTYTAFITNEFQYQNSLKAHKAEEEEIRKAEEAKLAAGKKNRSKSPSKRTGVSTTTPDAGSRRQSADKVAQRRSDSAHSLDMDREPYPFTCYDLANQMMVASGLTATLLPSDGGIIRAERFRFETGRESVRVSCLIDSNVFSVHIISPVADIQPQQQNGVLDSPRIGPVSHFGSVTASLANGVVLSVSSFGPEGICTEGAPYGPKSCVPGNLGPPEGHATPPPVGSPSTVKKGRAKSPQTNRSPRSKTGEKESKEKEKEQAKEKDATKDGGDRTSGASEETQRPPTIERPAANFTKSPLNISFPNALSVKFFYFTDEAGRFLLTVRQSYEKRRHPIAQPGAETSRLVTPDGCTIRFLQSGETQVLYPDGSMYTTQPVVVGPSAEEIAAAEAAAAEATLNSEQRGRSKQSQKPALGAQRSKNAAAAQATNKAEQDATASLTSETPTKQPPQIITHVTADGWFSRYSTVEGRYLEPKRKLSAINRTDAATGQKWISREDGVEIVLVPSGAAGNPPGVATRCVLYADGTCVTSRIETIISELSGDEEDVLTWVRVEAPSFATVTVDRLRWETQLELGNDSASGLSQIAISCLPDQSFQLFPTGGGRIAIDRQARLMYWPKQTSNAKRSGDDQAEHVYVLCHNSPTVVQAIDPAGNSFSVSHDGRAAVVSRQQQMEQQSQQNQTGTGTPTKPQSRGGSKRMEESAGDEMHAPRYFVVVPAAVGGIGGGWELKRYRGDVGSAIVSSERDPRCHLTRRAIDDEPRVTSITVLRPFAQLPGDRWSGTKCVVQDLAPPGLHPVGWYVPRSNAANANLKIQATLSTRNLLLGQQPAFSSPMTRIEVRRLFQLTPFTDPLRDVVIDAMRNFVESVIESNAVRCNLAPWDPRSAEEIRDSEILLARFSQIGTPRSTEEADAKVAAELEALGSPLSGGLNSGPFRTIKHEQRRVERLQAEEDRRAYRNGCKMSYFKSEFAHKFLKAQAPNLEDLFTMDEAQRLAEFDAQFASLAGQPTGEDQQQQQKFVIPDEPTDQQRPRAATPSQRRKIGADVLVINPETNAPRHAVETAVNNVDAEHNGYNVTKTPLFLPNILLVQPGSGVDFGDVPEGLQVTRQFWLKNAGQRPVRFSIKEPQPELGIYLRYEHGPIAPGMKRDMTITLKRNAQSILVSENCVNIKIRYDGGHLSVPIRFKEVKATNGLPRHHAAIRDSLLMSMGSDGDELLSEVFHKGNSGRNSNRVVGGDAVFDHQLPPQPAENNSGEPTDNQQQQQPRPPSYPRRSTPPISTA